MAGADIIVCAPIWTAIGSYSSGLKRHPSAEPWHNVDAAIDPARLTPPGWPASAGLLNETIWPALLM